MADLEAVVIGAGQAGLAASYELTRRGTEHVVLERARIGEAWRRRWDSFCLVTPNWSVQLPGYLYDGDDSDGFMPRDEIVAYLERYAASFRAPVKDGVKVDSVGQLGGKFVVETSAGEFRTASLVVATGAFQRPHLPSGADTLPAHLLRTHLDGYAKPEALPEGGVLIVGSGQSGCQIAEELHEAGRDVVLACGRAPWSPRRIGGRDVFWWLVESKFMEAGLDTLPKEARLAANILASGHNGGHDLHYRTLRALGVTLTGRFRGVAGGKAHFASDLAQSVAWGDERYQQLRKHFASYAEIQGLDVSGLEDPTPFDPAMPEEISMDRFGTVLFAGGFRPDYTSWLPWLDAFDSDGFPFQKDGTSTVVDGLHFVGLHFLRKRKSALLVGVGEDAAIVAEAVSGG